MNFPFMWYKNLGETFVRFVTIHACDGQMDTFAIGKTALHICSAVKTAKINAKKLLSLQHSVRATSVTPLKQQKISVFDPMMCKSPDVPLQAELLY